ncbi:MAG: hypothetical protein ACRD68_04315, partial [Pyrinomonadaceae bacterium]
PDEMARIAVSGEFPVYEVLPDVADPHYIKLLFRTSRVREIINSMVSGASGRKRVQPFQLESVAVPLPPLTIQQAIAARWRQSQDDVYEARRELRKVTDDLNDALYEHYYADCRRDILQNRWLVVEWKDLLRWDVKTARAAAFRISNPTFAPLGDFAEEATELVRPWLEPDKEWPVYGVNNTEGVFFSHHQKGKDFNAPYKRVKKDWFFHNPTRSSVGSLGIVPDVPEGALTSPEYQVWRIKETKKDELMPHYVAALINTPFFIKLIQFHRVGAVKQRLYVENLLEIHVPVLPVEEQLQVITARAAAQKSVLNAIEGAKEAEAEVEALILGTKKIEITH